MRITPAIVSAAPAEISPAGVFGIGKTTCVLLGSCYTAQWVGVSRLMLEWFAVGLPASFRLDNLTPPDTDSLLCVRSKKRRFKLFEDVGEVITDPLYNGETLYSDTVFELWSTPAVSGDFPDTTLRLLAASYAVSLPTYAVAASFHARVQLDPAPIHTVGPAPNPSLRFTNTTSLCP